MLLVAQRDAETPGAGGGRPVPRRRRRAAAAALAARRTARCDVLVEGSRSRAGHALRARQPTACAPCVAPMPAPVARRKRDEVAAAGRTLLSLFEEYVALHRRLPAEVVTLVQSAESPARQAFGIAAHLGDATRRAADAARAPTSCPPCSDALGDAARRARSSCCGSSARSTTTCAARCSRTSASSTCRSSSRRSTASSGRRTATTATTSRRSSTRRGCRAGRRARARELRRLRKHRRRCRPRRRSSRTYLDWIARAAVDASARDDVLDVAHARRVLDEDHYGLDEVKERILDYIAVLVARRAARRARSSASWARPASARRRSAARSRARSGRKFVRMSLGGVRDEAEIRGHRRTYIGAMPGRVIQAMRRAEVVNPVILLDEIDKLGQRLSRRSVGGAARGARPEQNRAFNDHYLEVDYDLSQVLFITTANSLAGDPRAAARPHGDHPPRRAISTRRSYAIARQFLVPRQLSAARHRSGDGDARRRTSSRRSCAATRARRACATSSGASARLARKLARARAERRSAYAPTRAMPPPEHDTVQASQLHALLGVAPYDPSTNTARGQGRRRDGARVHERRAARCWRSR